MREPTITINGHVLTEAQAMSVRVAIGMFFIDLADPKTSESLGELAPLYGDRLREVSRFMGTGIPA